MAWKEDEEPTVDEVAKQLRQYEESLSSSLQACVSAVEKLSEEVHQLKETLFSSPPVQTSVSAIRGSVHPCKEDDMVGTHPVPPCGFTCVTMERT